MDSTTPGSVSAPARLPPFSLIEFRALVSAALDSSPSLSLSLPIPTALRKKSSAQSLHSSPPSHLHSHSRIRLLLTKLKKRAAALVKRRRTYSKPSASVRVAVSSVVDPDSARSRSSAADSMFTPYLPLPAQHERALHDHQGGDPYSRSYPSGFVCASPSPSFPFGGAASPEPSSSGSESSHSHTHAPPSPTASTFSASSASDESSYAYAHAHAYNHVSAYVPPYYSSSALPYPSPSFDRPWSVVTRDSLAPGAGASKRTMAGLGPSAIGHYEAESDPFAKAAVRVVHRSCEALPGTHHYFGGSPARWLRSASGAGSTSVGGSPSTLTAGGRMRRAGGRERRTRVRSRVPTTEERQEREEYGKQDEREEEAEAEDSGVYLHLDRDHADDLDPDREQLPTPPPSPSFSRRSSAFVPVRCSTPPPPPSYLASSSHLAPTTPASSSSYSSRLERKVAPTPTTPTSNLARAPTARTYPVPTRARTRAWPHRPSSPFPLPLTRKGTTCTN
ncbi:hypothetical protein B0H13DRAFT_2330292 [Mycena leptocephala]|nr:hypothetical protein B0H13DRAFT_2330292 [Mycena leptocephala]